MPSCSFYTSAPINFRRLIGHVILLLVLARAGGLAQCVIPPVDPSLSGSSFQKLPASDNTFYPDNVFCGGTNTGGLACSATALLGRTSGNQVTTVTPAVFELTRVVGPGTSGEFNGDGTFTLANWTTYVANGVLSAQAYVYVVSAFGVHEVQNMTVYVNGNQAGQLQFDLLEGACIPISTQYLKFPQRGTNDALPGPAVNNLTFALDGCCGIAAAVSTLTFQAMAPVIMVHGWNSGPWWWGDSPSTSTCGLDTSGGIRNGGFGFIDPFVSGHYPFDCSIKITPNTLNDEGGAIQLQKALLDCPSGGGIPDASFMCPNGSHATGKLAAFGAKHVHLVVHSKGGLWSRQMLYDFPTGGNQLFGAYSLTTLETPHLGSSLADLSFAGRRVPLFMLLGILSIDPRIIAAMTQSTAGQYDMEVGVATSNDGMWGAGPGTFTVDGSQNNTMYYAVGSDADVNGNGKIDGASNPGDQNTRPDEGFPPPHLPQIIQQLFQTQVQNQRFQWLGQVRNGNIHRLRVLGRTVLSIADFDPTATFQLNDLSVTVASALGGRGFQQPAQGQMCNALPCRLANHTTAGSSFSWNQAAQQVLSFIQQAQPIQ